MASISKTLRVVVAMAMLTTTPVVDAQTMVCGPNGCRLVSGQPVRNVARVATAPVRRVVTRGLFGRRRVSYESVPASAVESYGSTGGYSSWTTYESAPRYSSYTTTKSYGSTGGTAQPVGAGYGSHGGSSLDAASTPLGSGPASTTTATVPSAGVCECECPACGTRFRCECSQTSSVPSPLPTQGLCVIPPVAVTGTCRVPEPAPSVGAIAGL